MGVAAPKDLTPGTRLVLRRIRRRRRWVTCRELADGMTTADWIALGFSAEFLLYGTPVRPPGVPSWAPLRVSGRLRRLREAGYVEQRVDVEETRTGGLRPVMRWRAVPARALA